MRNLWRAVPLALMAMATSPTADSASLYQVSLLRAHPGEMPALVEDVQQEKKRRGGDLVILRHSQGDHWDLMLLSPAPTDPTAVRSYGHRVDFQHDFLASSETSWQQVRKLSADTGLFHVEMFRAARGQYDALLKERHMENDYLVATQRRPNVVFETVFGSDVDLFTVGFYADMQEFAAEPALDPAEFEKAAKDAGFPSRSEIGFYLRRFLVSHQDTLATQVR